MGTKVGGGRRSSLSGPPAPAVVCCMCGDYGLRNELFQCKVCLHRSQHKYCSDLYPKAEIYTACNWCLRGAGKALTKNSSSSLSSSSNDSANSGGGNGGGDGVRSSLIHRTAFGSQLNKPIKKQKAPERSKSDVTDRLRSVAAATAAGMSPVNGRGRHVFRAKVRRYKLLEEVSS